MTFTAPQDEWEARSRTVQALEEISDRLRVIAEPETDKVEKLIKEMHLQRATVYLSFAVQLKEILDDEELNSLDRAKKYRSLANQYEQASHKISLEVQ